MIFKGTMQKMSFSTTTKDYFTPADVKGGKITLKDIHNHKEEIVKIKDPTTSKNERKQIKSHLLMSLAKSSFPGLTFESESDVQFHVKSSSEFRVFVNDFNVLFSTAQRMPHKYFAHNISFETWIKVLEGREKVSMMNERHNNEIAALAQQRKATLQKHREDVERHLSEASIVVQIDNLTLDHVPAESLDDARKIKDAEIQAKKLREILMDFKAAELARFTKSPTDYKIPVIK